MANPKPVPCVENLNNPNNTGVVLDVPMYEGSGNPSDVSGTGATLTINGGLTWGTGQYGSDLVFNGSTGYLSSGSSASLPLGSTGRTFSGWIYLTAYPAGVTSILSYGTAANFQMLWWSVAGSGNYAGYTSGLMMAEFFSATRSSSIPIALNTWTHITIRIDTTVDGVNSQFFINGTPDGWINPQGSSGVLNTTDSGLAYIGNVTPGGLVTTSTLAGSLDGLTVWNNLLTNAQIKQVYADAFARFRAISPIQASTLASVTAATTATTSFTSLPTVGNAVKVDTWGICTSVLGTPTITDNQTGNTYGPVKFSQDTSLASGEFAGQWLLPAVVGTSGMFSVTLTASSASIINVIMREYNPGLTADQNNSATGNSASPAGGAVTTATADELVSTTFGSLDTSNPATITPPSGFYLNGSQLGGVAAGVGGASDAVYSTTVSALNPTSTLDGSFKWSAVTATYKVTSGGNSYTRTCTDGPTTSESMTRAFQGFRSPTDAPHTTESLTRTESFNRSAPDASQTAEIVTRTFVGHRTTTDVPATAEAVTRTWVGNRTNLDSPTTADAVARRLTGVRTTTEVPTTSEAVSGLFIGFRTTTDAPNTTETATGIKGRVVVTADSPQTSESASRSFTGNRTTADSPATSESINKVQTAIRNATDSPATSESLSRSALFVRATTDNPASSESVIQQLIHGRLVSESILTSEVAIRLFVGVRTALDSLTFSEMAIGVIRGVAVGPYFTEAGWVFVPGGIIGEVFTAGQVIGDVRV